MEIFLIVVYCFLGGVVLLLIAMLAKTLACKKTELPSLSTDFLEIDEDILASHLSKAITYETVTLPTDEEEDDVFLEYHSFLENSYPLIMKGATKKVINRYSVIYTYPGTNLSLLPIALLAHQDVVPAPVEGWEFPPFSGHLTEDGYIYGRGTQDMKSQMIASLFALELLLKDGFQPERTIYFCFGHDEELGGRYGAKKIVEYLTSQNIRFEYVLDEGGAIIDGKLMGIDNFVALIGICEKGYADIQLSASIEGGHASSPTRKTAVGTLCKAIARLEKKPMKKNMPGPVNEMLIALAPHMNFLFKFAIVNMKILAPLLKFVFSVASPFTNCLVRTTMAPTQLFGATTPNTLPSTAYANINCRINTGETIDELVTHIKKVVGKNITVSVDEKSKNPSPVSKTDSPAFHSIRKTTQEAFNGFVVAPYPFIATSDSAYYHAVSDNVYRFTPLLKDESDANRIHGKNERITKEMLVDSVKFFLSLFKNTCT